MAPEPLTRAETMARQMTRNELRNRIHDREAQDQIDDALCGISDGEQMRINEEDRKWYDAQIAAAYARDEYGFDDECDDYEYWNYGGPDDEFEDGDGNVSRFSDDRPYHLSIELGKPFNEVFLTGSN